MNCNIQTQANSQEQQRHLALLQVQRNRKAGCSHSFNDNDECEYCGLSQSDYDGSCADGNPIGTYE